MTARARKICLLHDYDHPRRPSVSDPIMPDDMLQRCLRDRQMRKFVQDSMKYVRDNSTVQGVDRLRSLHLRSWVRSCEKVCMTTLQFQLLGKPAFLLQYRSDQQSARIALRACALHSLLSGDGICGEAHGHETFELSPHLLKSR
jgi:hypothetical protein